MCKSGRKISGGCRCRGGPLRGFVQPRLLLLLARRPAHGYELMEGLDQAGDVAAADPGNLYRMLHALEEGGLVLSTWDTGSPGPARRVYEITPAGIESLAAWADNISETRRKLDVFLAEYEKFSIEQKEKNQ